VEVRDNHEVTGVNHCDFLCLLVTRICVCSKLPDVLGTLNIRVIFLSESSNAKHSEDLLGSERHVSCTAHASVVSFRFSAIDCEPFLICASFPIGKFIDCEPLLHFVESQVYNASLLWCVVKLVHARRPIIDWRNFGDDNGALQIFLLSLNHGRIQLI
jgi:hypothetical protein